MPLPALTGPRAFRVLHAGRLLGYLGDEPGAFETSRGAAEPGPPGCRFRSVSVETEGAILELLHASTDFEVRLQVLERAGLRLEETCAEGLFSPSSVVLRLVVPSAALDDDDR